MEPRFTKPTEDDREVESDSPVTEIESDSSFTEIESGSPYTEIESNSLFTEIESDSPYTEIESDSLFTEIESDSPYTEIESESDSPVTKSEMLSLEPILRAWWDPPVTKRDGVSLKPSTCAWWDILIAESLKGSLEPITTHPPGAERQRVTLEPVTTYPGRDPPVTARQRVSLEPLTHTGRDPPMTARQSVPLPPITHTGRDLLVTARQRVPLPPITHTRMDPPVTPPKKGKKELVPSPTVFEALDKHAINAPETCCETISSLAQYLIQPANGDVEKVRVFFRWITHNIRYNKIGLINGERGPQEPLPVLLSKLAVCEGYSRLFKALCDEEEIPCKTITGLSKGSGYDPETGIKADSDDYHAWNIVCVNENWWPVDTTWAAGAVDEQTNIFRRHFTELYFLTDPEDFVINHFPYMNNSYAESCCYQLLANPLSIEEFDTAIAPHTGGIEWGFHSRTHRQVVDLDKVCKIQIATLKVKIEDVSCEFKYKQTGKDYKTYVLLRKLSDSAFTVKITPPETGKYELTLFGKYDQSAGEYKALMTYIIRCHSVMANVAPYPEHMGTWGIRIPFTSYGFNPDIGKIDVITAKAGRTEIKVKVSPEVKLSFQLQHSQENRDDLDRFVMAFINKGMMNVKFRFPICGYFRFRVFAKNLQGTKETLDYIGDILIKSKDIHSDRSPYPKGQGLLGLKADVRKYGIISTFQNGEEIVAENGEAVMKFKVNHKMRASFKLEHAETNQINLNRFLIAYIEGRYLIIKLRLPVIGYYNLEMFAQNLSERQNSSIDFIGQFLLSCTESCEDIRSYPEKWNLWGAKATATEYGFTSAIFSYNILSATDGKIAIDLPVDPSVSVSFCLSHSTDDIPDIGRYVFSYIKSNILHVRVRLTRSGFYKFSIFARHSDDDLFGCHDHIGDFLLESKSSIKKP